MQNACVILPFSGLSGCTKILHLIWQTVRFSEIKLLSIELCLILSTTFVWNISHSKKNSALYYYKCTHIRMQITRQSCRILMKLELFWRVVEQSSNTKFSENHSSGSRVVPRRQNWRNKQLLFAIFRIRLKNLLRSRRIVVTSPKV